MELVVGKLYKFKTRDGSLEVEFFDETSVFFKDMKTGFRCILPTSVFMDVCEASPRRWEIWYNKEFNHFSNISPEEQQTTNWEKLIVQEEL